MVEMSVGLRGCAILGPGGEPLAASGDSTPWAEAGGRLFAAARAGAPGEAPVHVHVGTEDGEAFALRHGELLMIAVTERFVLTSLVLSDMRTLLRDVAAGAVADHRAPERGEIPIERESEEEMAATAPEAGVRSAPAEAATTTPPAA